MLISNTGISKTGISSQDLENGIIAFPIIMPPNPTTPHTNTLQPRPTPHPTFNDIRD